MNLYFLVEGVTERKVYPAWLKVLLPSHQRVNVASEAVSKNYYLISGGGFPHLLDRTLADSVDEIEASGKYNYLVVVLDSDENSVIETKNEVTEYIEPYTSKLGNCVVKVIVQNCCIESWLLGNRRIFSRQPQSEELRRCVACFDVFNDDPEQMDKPANYNSPKVAYHLRYLKAVFRERQTSYTKTRPKDATKKYYLNALLERCEQRPTHLYSLQDFVGFCLSLS